MRGKQVPVLKFEKDGFGLGLFRHGGHPHSSGYTYKGEDIDALRLASKLPLKTMSTRNSEVVLGDECESQERHRGSR